MDLLDGMQGAVTGKMLVAQVLFSTDFLSWLALNQIPLCYHRIIRHSHSFSCRLRGSSDKTCPTCRVAHHKGCDITEALPLLTSLDSPKDKNSYHNRGNQLITYLFSGISNNFFAI